VEPRHVGGARLDLFLGALVECHQADGRRRNAPLLHQVACPFGEHPGLAGASRGDDACRAAVVSDRLQLVGSQLGSGGVANRRLQRAVLDRHTVQHRHAIDWLGEAGRPAIEPGELASGQLHIAAPVADRPGAQLDGTLYEWPPRDLAAKVECVRHAQVGNRIVDELVPWPHLVRWLCARLGGDDEVAVYLDDHRRAGCGERSQLGEGRRAGADHDPWRVGPVGWRGLARRHDDVAAQFGRAAVHCDSERRRALCPLVCWLDER